ncbi:hypothetical protein, partial [Escherichia coli]|uniref:hypothetical protein n=1 Tax=Escherichia coli TaxID=562 RepID=UPI001BD3FF42
ADFRLKRHRFDGVFLCALCFDISDSYFTNVRFRSIRLCAVKSRTYLAGESPAPEGAASATG